ncbi:MAG: hypothetical protein M3134_00685, partial [Actinomycetota bacterium]|nr:hypothetical protein [Actinomycetota bacterium]
MRKAVAAVVALLLAAACTGSGAEERAESEATPRPSQAPNQGRAAIASPEAVTQAPDGWFEAACSLPLEQLKR